MAAFSPFAVKTLVGPVDPDIDVNPGPVAPVDPVGPVAPISPGRPLSP